MSTLRSAPLKLFICTSITQKVGKPAEIARLCALVETIDRTAEAHGATTSCGFREEGWKGMEDPALYVPRDFKWVRECDAAILIPEDSWGVRLELGALAILEKPMLRLYEGDTDYKTGVESETGLGQLTPIFDRVFHSLEDVEQHVKEFIDFLRSLKDHAR